mgnify:CR=1 FL=1|tara:strand:+ start:156 stop:461 length:306 start_codon:yes stop_codon:yes gene_type:complete
MSAKNIGITSQSATHSLDITDSAVTNAPDLNRRTESVFLDVQGGDVYVSFGSTDPSASTPYGHILYDRKDYVFYAELFASAKFISASGNVKIHVTELDGHA